jgi:hypothetical protein
VYRHYRVAFNVTWNDDKSIITYRQWVSQPRFFLARSSTFFIVIFSFLSLVLVQQYFVFDPEASVGDESTMVTTLNMVFIGNRGILLQQAYVRLLPRLLALLLSLLLLSISVSSYLSILSLGCSLNSFLLLSTPFLPPVLSTGSADSLR